MSPGGSPDADPAALRRRAEEALRARPNGSTASLSGDEAIRLVEELRVHQVELELQNEELRRTRRETEELRDRYADLYDFAPVGYFTLDADGVIREANLTGSLLLATDRQTLIGRRFSAFLDPVAVRPFERFCDRVRCSGSTETCDVLVSGRAGHDDWYAQLKGRAEPARGDGGPRLRLVASDITDRKRTEQALRTSNEELQRYAYVASHDLQEPLRSIVSFSRLLEKRYRGKLDQDADEYINFIVEGGNRMQQLILDMLEFSRVVSRAGPRAPTDPRLAASAALRLLEGPIAEAGATVEVGELPVVTADPTQLEQVFANLVGNAVKYRRESVPPAIAISAHRVNGTVEFAVRDNGIGIEAEYFDRIFDMFSRLHTRERYGGTGIGLAVVKRIVERHGGRIRVESVPGEGSTFFFTLPAAREM